MESKAIIDEHFKSNYEYYRRVCRRYYRGRYLFEDLLQELYLFLIGKEKTVLKYHKDNKLHCLCLISIKELYGYRKQKLNHKDGKTSNLFEGSNFELLEIEDEPIELFEIEEKKIDLIKNEVWSAIGRVSIARRPEEITDYDHDISVFCAAQTESIRSISRRTGINRASLNDSNERAILQLKRIIK